MKIKLEKNHNAQDKCLNFSQLGKSFRICFSYIKTIEVRNIFLFSVFIEAQQGKFSQSAVDTVGNQTESSPLYRCD